MRRERAAGTPVHPPGRFARIKGMRATVLTILLFSLPASALMAAEQAFPPTPSGVIELKTLPAGVLLQSTGRGNYFDESNRLFRPLFRYISRHDIAMTTPVEARIEGAAMYFWVSEGQQAKVAGDEGGVTVLRQPPRRVASAGARGAYSRGNFETVRARLLAWLEEHPELIAAGEPYAVYWHGPFTPWFAKAFEVHVPLRNPE